MTTANVLDASTTGKFQVLVVYLQFYGRSIKSHIIRKIDKNVYSDWYSCVKSSLPQVITLSANEKSLDSYSLIYSADYERVTSGKNMSDGRECGWIETKEECEVAARFLVLASGDTTATSVSNGHPVDNHQRPRGCFAHGGGLYFNQGGFNRHYSCPRISPSTSLE